MSIRVRCPGCNAEYALADSMAGKKVRCKKCEAVIAVKAPPPANAPAGGKIPAWMKDDVPRKAKPDADAPSAKRPPPPSGPSRRAGKRNGALPSGSRIVPAAPAMRTLTTCGRSRRRAAAWRCGWFSAAWASCSLGCWPASASGPFFSSPRPPDRRRPSPSSPSSPPPTTSPFPRPTTPSRQSSRWRSRWPTTPPSTWPTSARVWCSSGGPRRASPRPPAPASS